MGAWPGVEMTERNRIWDIISDAYTTFLNLRESIVVCSHKKSAEAEIPGIDVRVLAGWSTCLVDRGHEVQYSLSRSKGSPEWTILILWYLLCLILILYRLWTRDWEVLWFVQGDSHPHRLCHSFQRHYDYCALQAVFWEAMTQPQCRNWWRATPAPKSFIQIFCRPLWATTVSSSSGLSYSLFAPWNRGPNPQIGDPLSND